MKFTLNILEKRGNDDDTEAEHRWPQYVFGGRMRTSTFVLIVAFLLVWWVYDTYRPEPAPKPPAQQVVPPGFVPDPNYTWVPRSRLQQPHERRLTRTRRADQEDEFTLVDLDVDVLQRRARRRFVFLGDVVQGDHHGTPV